MSFLLSLALLAQVGPAPSLNLPTGLEDRKPRRPAAETRAPDVPRARTPLQECMSAVNSDPLGAVDIAEAWLAQTKGTPTAPAQFCLGSAHAALEHWDEAETAFLAGRDAAAASDLRLRAQMGAMAGTTALARGEAARALSALDQAHADALAAPDAELAGDIQVDRSRALVALKREAEAATALAEAQIQIETAVGIEPRDPAIGLEAGVIAVLSGRDAAARKSWESVVAAVPESDAARTATGYLAQLATPAGK
jgi:tetratricopeptide (TPR) repeat protein